MSNFDSSTFSHDEADASVNTGAKTSRLGAHWTFEDWKVVETLFAKGTFDSKVSGLMKSHCDASFGMTAEDAKNTFRVLGEMYDRIVPLLVEAKLISASASESAETPAPAKTQAKTMKPGQKGSGKKDGLKKETMNKVMQIRFDNACRIVEEQAEAAVKSINLKEFVRPGVLTSQYLELRLVGFLIMFRFLLKHKKTLAEVPSKMLFVNNIIVAAKRFAEAVTGLKGQSLLGSEIEFSATALEHLKERVALVVTEFNFSGLQICQYTPQLQMYTDYDNAIPQAGLCLYPHQKKLIDALYTAIVNDDALMVTLRTTTGTGKTTIAAGMAYLVNHFAKQSTLPDGQKPVFVFCCSVRGVTDQVGNIAYNMGVPLGYAYMDDFKGYRLIRNWNCRDKSGVEHQPALILCDPYVCKSVLAEFPEAVLFIDEPTIGLDVMSDTAKANVELISQSLRRRTFLSSATLPEVCPKWILDSHREKYGEFVYIDEYSNKIHVGCEMYTLEGELVLSHIGCKTATELRRIIEMLQRNPFVGRAYTANVVVRMHAIMTEHGISGIPDIKAFFADVHNINANSIRNFALDMLRALSSHSDSVVETVCAEKVETRQLKKLATTKDTDSDIVWEAKQKASISHSVDFKSLLTSHAHRFLGPTLIATTSPVEFVKENFTEYVKAFGEEFGSISSLLKAVERIQADFDKKLERLDKADTADSKLDQERKRAELAEEKASHGMSIRGFEVNTSDHLRKFAANFDSAIDPALLRKPLDAADIQLIFTSQMNVKDEHRILLACGVAIIGTLASREYNSIAIRLFTEGKLAFAVADAGIAYGTNVPLNRVIVTKDFSDTYSIKTIFQLIARAGRVGKSWIAETFIDSTCATKLIEMIRAMEENDIELANLNELHEQFLSAAEFDADLVLAEIEREEALNAQRKAEEKAKYEAENKAKREAEEKAKREAEEKAKREAEEKAKAEAEAWQMSRRQAQRSNRVPAGTPIGDVMNAAPKSAPEVKTNANGFTRRPAAKESDQGSAQRPRRSLLANKFAL